MDFPSVFDGEIIEEMKNLEMMIVLHRKACEIGINDAIECPNEIYSLIDWITLSRAWEFQEYEVVREIYAKAWIEYYRIHYNSEPYYTVDQLVVMFVRRSR